MSIFYNINKIMSYDSPLLYFTIGNRGCGKTFAATEFIIKQFLKNNHEFIYLRRYKSDLKESKEKFFDDMIKNEKFKNHEFSVKGNTFFIDKKICGYAVNLSTTQQKKSVNYSKVKYIIFDEFLVEKGQTRYLKNEVNSFLSFLDTVNRLKENLKVICLGNSTDLLNPYFLYFNIQLPYNNTIKLFNDNTILVEYVDNEEFKKFRKKSKFGKLIKNTDYEKFSIDNQFIDVIDKKFIEHKGKNAKLSFNFLYNNKYYGVWWDFETGKIFVSYNHDTTRLTFACTTKDLKPNILLYSIASDYNCWKTFIKNYKLGNVYFENQKIKIICDDIFKNLILRR